MKPHRDWTKIVCWLVLLVALAIFWLWAFGVGMRIVSHMKVQAASSIGPWVGLRVPILDNLKRGQPQPYWFFKMDPDQFQVVPDPAGTSDGIFGLKPSLAGAVGTVVAYALSNGEQDATGTAVLDLSMSASKAAPSGLQWEMSFNPAEVGSLAVASGPTALTATKTVSCSTGSVSPVRCLIYGTNQNPIPNGVAARVTVQAKPGVVTASVVLSNVVSTSATAQELASVVIPGGGMISSPVRGAVLLGDANGHYPLPVGFTGPPAVYRNGLRQQPTAYTVTGFLAPVPSIPWSPEDTILVDGH